MNKPALRLFLLGFLTLFLELALIRYLAGNVWNMGFFPNLVLMGVFIGMGAGFVFHQVVSEEKSPKFFAAAAFALLVLATFVYYTHPGVPGFNKWVGTIGGEVYFNAGQKDADAWNYLFFVLIFLGIVLTFALISQRTAKYFRTFPPLRAYTLDILGSCCGILSFMLISWLRVPSYYWFALVLVLFLLIETSNRGRTAIVLATVVVFAWLSDQRLLSDPSIYSPQVKWSPYQKVEYVPSEGASFIYVNGISHQGMLDKEGLKHSFYILPYAYRSRNQMPPPSDVLIIGAGSGNDVAAALSNGAQHVDAVEIDPVIAGIGKRSHPVRPYQDPRVNQVVDDGRAFMTYTTRHYDVIIFALTDSLVKVSPVAQLRLENYLFTDESVKRACSLLKPGGMVFFYNFYRMPWVRDKIQAMIFDASGVWPQVVYQTKLFTMMGLDRNRPAAKPVIETGLQIPRDDWPFLYLKEHGIPSLYLKAMFGVGIFVLLLAIFVQRSAKNAEGESSMNVKLAFLFMGVAFLLLETKSVIQFALLFGTTWLNNSLVFLAVLIFVLAANWAATLLKSRRTLVVSYALLLVFCVSAYVYPLGKLLSVQSVALRFVAASVLTFAPIFFANVIFSVTFRERKLAEHLFGWNLIGAAFGGILEYSSMALGYNALALVVAGCYTAVFLLLQWESNHRVTATQI